MSENSVFVGLSAVLLFLNRQIFWSNFWRIFYRDSQSREADSSWHPGIGN